MDFRKTNNITGWGVFCLSLLVYCLTLEETASYWDCGEFIAVSYKLEVPHPPGAPLFLLMGRLFSFLAMGDTLKVALWINFMSALASAFTVLFLFWSITLIGRRLVKPEKGTFTPNQVLLLMGAGVTGALSYAFSDSFWFSAVEAEVYAMSFFFTSFVVWGMLKWTLIDDDRRANKWFILLAYMMGLSIGIHLLNLVTIPALGLLYYYKKYKPSRWGVILALFISLFVVFFINGFIVPGLPSIAGHFEIFFVNTMNMPFGSGVAVFVLLLVGIFVYGIWYSHRRKKPILNTVLLCFAFILIGYSSYTIILVRSNFNPPINENAPRDAMTFVSYLKREQYGSRPLLVGPYYTSKPVAVKQGGPIYVKGKDRYEVADRQYSYEYDKEIFFPRTWSADQADAYRRIMGLRQGEIPTFTQNIYFMFRHQLGTMYMRYFLWNVAGRESDIEMADWLGPGSWFDEVPPGLVDNKGRNNFFMIPLLIGLLGAFFHFKKDRKGFAFVTLLFILLGAAIVVYLNPAPIEPRERDYIYTGSVYAFTFWIGFAVIYIAGLLQKYLKRAAPSTALAILVVFSAPALMAFEGWDDHDRSNRFFSVDSGKNYLTSVAPEAVLFTGGDNDTFMLWYAQEVEDFRPDVRVVVLSYYNTDWYIEQSMRQVNRSNALPYTLSLHNYRQGGPNDYIPFVDMGIASIDLKQYLDLLRKGHPQLQNDGRNILPSRMLTLNIDKEKVLAAGIIPKGMEDLVVDQMQLPLIGNGLEKKDLAFLDMLATNNWKRPIYVNHTSLSQFKIDLTPYVVTEGNVSHILPIRNPNPKNPLINIRASYDNLIHKYFYRGLTDGGVYYSEDYRNFALNHRSSLNTLAAALIHKGSLDSAKQVLIFNLEKIVDDAIPYDQSTLTTIDLLFKVGEKEKALAIAKRLGERAGAMCSYLMRKRSGLTQSLRRNTYIVAEMQTILLANDEKELAKTFEAQYQEVITYLRSNSLLLE